MTHYITIQIIASKELKENRVLNALMGQLHKSLAQLKSTDVGISFPLMRITPGTILRIHGTPQRLQELPLKEWVSGLPDNCKISEIQEVPADVEHCMFSRKQRNMSASKLRRLIKRGTISPEDINTYREKMFDTFLDFNLPFIELDSTSNGNHYIMHIKKSETFPTAKIGQFNSFGLSRIATVPMF